MPKLGPTAKQNSTRRSTSSILSCKLAYRRPKNSAKRPSVRHRSKSKYLKRRPKPRLRMPERSSRARQEDEFLIVGYTPPSGARKYFGALLLAADDEGQLRYVGKLGTGFSQE